MNKKVMFSSSLVFTGVLSFLMSNSSYADTYTKTALIRVSDACTMTANSQAAPHTKTIPLNTYEAGIGTTIVSTACNDNGGFAVYAIGFTDDTDGNNYLEHGTDSSIKIATGTAESGNTSNWAMKLEAVNNNSPLVIDNGYDDYSVVPDDYVKVAHRTSATNTDTSIFKTTYAAFINATQPAGTYTGQVKYVLVHPSTGPAPEKETPEVDPDPLTTTFDEAYGRASKTRDTASNKFKMQDMTTAICTAVTRGQTGVLVDIRDHTEYTVAKLADDRCWLTDNLALDLTSSAVQSVMDDSNTNASSTALGYLFGVTSRELSDVNNKYAAGGVGLVSQRSNALPLIWVSAKDDVPTDSMSTSNSWKTGILYNYCAATAASFCFGNHSGYGVPANNGGDPSGTAIDASEDICPTGWRLPTGYTVDATSRPDGGEYIALNNAYSSNYSNIRTALRLPLSGRINYNGVTDSGTKGWFWTSTYAGSSSIYAGFANTSVFNAASGSSAGYLSGTDFTSARYYGISVRCIAK